MSIRPYALRLPHGCTDCEVVGFLYDSDDPTELGQDMVEVRLPIGVAINAGWYPEGDAAGKYIVRTWGQVKLQPIECSDIDEAARIINRLMLVLLLRRFWPEPISESANSYESSVYKETWEEYEVA